MTHPRIPHWPFRRFVLATCCLLALLFLPFLLYTRAQQGCTSPDFRSSAQAWAPNSIVAVNINANQFSPAQYGCLKAAFDNWNAISGNDGNQSGVRFNVNYSTTVLGTMSASGTLDISGKISCR